MLQPQRSLAPVLMAMVCWTVKCRVIAILAYCAEDRCRCADLATCWGGRGSGMVEGRREVVRDRCSGSARWLGREMLIVSVIVSVELSTKMSAEK